jgi:hypothetical protein
VCFFVGCDVYATAILPFPSIVTELIAGLATLLFTAHFRLLCFLVQRLTARLEKQALYLFGRKSVFLAHKVFD